MVEDHGREHTTLKLLDLYKEQEAETVEETLSKEEGSNWAQTQNMVEKWRPNIATVNQNKCIQWRCKWLLQ